MQTLQLQHMNERIREARQIRHNTRHHIQTLQTLASANDVDGIRDYLEQMAKHRLLAPEHPMQYCEHASLNAVLAGRQPSGECRRGDHDPERRR